MYGKFSSNRDSITTGCLTIWEKKVKKFFFEIASKNYTVFIFKEDKNMFCWCKFLKSYQSSAILQPNYRQY